MVFYHKLGKIPHKRHTVFRKGDGSLYHEHLMGTLGFALIFIRISIVIPDPETLAKITGPVSMLLQFFSVVYFGTSVAAVIFILWDAVTLDIEYLRVYLVWVLLIGLAVGTGLFFISHNWQSLLLNDYSQFFSIFKFLTSYVG